MPDLPIALGYEIVFRVPVSELFAGLHDEVAVEIEARLATLEERLGRRSARDHDAKATARKLLWLSERKNALCESSS
jgi:hypothetical protein